MNASARGDDRIKGVVIENEKLRVELHDGRMVTVPLAWYPRLAKASPQQRANWHAIAQGHGIHWPDIDEDLSVDGLLRGLPDVTATTGLRKGEKARRPQPVDARPRAVEAARLLNLFVLDLVVGTRSIEIFESPELSAHISPVNAVGINRMVLSHLVVTLSKWSEFYRRYLSILPADVRSACHSLNQQIVLRGIVDFRNTVVGHIVDSRTKRPLTSDEINRKLNHILAGDEATFLLWINDPSDNSFPKTVVGITEFVRDRLREEYRLTDDEIV